MGVPRVRCKTDDAVIHDTDVLTSVFFIVSDGRDALPNFILE